MNARFLLDSNAVSEPLRVSPDRLFLQRFDQFRATLAIAAVTWHEALYGLHRMPPGRRRQEVEDFLLNVLAPAVDILPYDADCAAWHAEHRARLDRAGKRPPFADGQIAAVAAVRGLTLVTRNVRDFEDWPGLHVVNWLT